MLHSHSLKRSFNHSFHFIFLSILSFHVSCRKQSYPEVMLESDLVTAAVTTTGVMIDIGFSGIAFVGDREKNARCYGAEATSSAVLGGSEVLPPEMDELAEAIQHASCAALVAAFEPSNAHSESEDEDAKAC